MVKAVIFDMDGVIFDTERLCIDAWKILAEREGMTGIEEVCHRCIGRTTPETERILRECYGENLDIKRLHGELRRLLAEMTAAEGIPVKLGVKEILDSLKGKVRLAVASSTRAEVVKAQLAAAGFLTYFDEIIGGDMVKNGKPAPDIYLAACERLAIQSQQSLAIEDSFNGVRAAHSAGLTTLMVPDILAPDEEMTEKAYAICKNLCAARDVILTLI